MHVDSELHFLDKLRANVVPPMSDLDTCLTANLAVRSASLGLAVLALIDALARDIPSVVAKARLTAFLAVLLSLMRWIYSGNHPGNTTQASLIILFVPAAMSAQLFFCEIFLKFCVDAVKLNGVTVSNRVIVVIGSLSWVCGLSILYAAALIIAFQFEPTNATMAASHAATIALWVSSFAMVFIVAFMMHAILSHSQQTVCLCSLFM